MVVGVMVGNDVRVVIGVVIVARSQLLSMVGSRVLCFCVGIVEIGIPIQVLSISGERYIIGHQCSRSANFQGASFHQEATP